MPRNIFVTAAAITNYLSDKLAAAAAAAAAIVQPRPAATAKAASAAAAAAAAAAATGIGGDADFLQQLLEPPTDQPPTLAAGLAPPAAARLALPPPPWALPQAHLRLQVPVVGVLSLEMAPLMPTATTASVFASSFARASSSHMAAPSAVPLADTLRSIPLQRWDRTAAADPLLADALGSGAADAATQQLQPQQLLPAQFGGFLAGVEDFDAAVFGLSAGEAAAMDPQHRLLLQLAVTASASASSASASAAATAAGAEAVAAAAATAAARRGVFLGISWTEYHALSRAHGSAAAAGPYAAQGAVLSVAAGRIAYHLGLGGPAMAVDTACSSSLVATALARGYLTAPTTTTATVSFTNSQQLQQYESAGIGAGVAEALSGATALVGGINMMLLPSTTAMFQTAGMLSPDGRCKALDAAADGYVRSEAAVMMMLAAMGSQVGGAGSAAGPKALLLGAAVNQDGRSSSLTAPNGPAQQSLLRQVLREAGLTPAAVAALQLHGTGGLVAGRYGVCKDQPGVKQTRQGYSTRVILHLHACNPLVSRTCHSLLRLQARRWATPLRSAQPSRSLPPPPTAPAPSRVPVMLLLLLLLPLRGASSSCSCSPPSRCWVTLSRRRGCRALPSPCGSCSSGSSCRRCTCAHRTLTSRPPWRLRRRRRALRRR